MKRSVVLLIAVLVMLSRGNASENAAPVATLPEVIIEGRVSGGVRTFSKAEIERSGARSAAEFLERVYGVSIRQDAASGGKKFARMGGSNVNQVLVLVDGVRLADVGSGEADLSRIPVEWMESMEVISGGGSTYGSEAIGGVISIETRAPSHNATRAHARGSGTKSEVGVLQEWSKSDVSAAISVTRESGDGDYRFRVTEEDGNGPFTIHLGEEFRRENNHVMRDRLIGSYKLKSGRHTLVGSGSVERAEYGLPGYLAPRPTPQANQRDQYRQFVVNWNAPTKIGRSSATAGLQEQTKEFTDPDPYSFLKESHESSSRATFVSSLQREFSGIHATLTNRVERERLISGVIQNSLAERNRWQSGVHFAHRVGLGDAGLQSLGLASGANVERFGDSDVKVLPSVDISFSSQVVIPVKVGGRYAESYLAPSFYSLFWNDELLAQGNPKLKPESSEMHQAYLHMSTHSKHRTSLELTASRSRVEDLIYWRQAFDGRWTPQNLRKASLVQVSISVSQVLWPECLDADLSVNWLEARDRSGERVTDGKYLIYRPLRSAQAGLAGKIRGFSGVIRARWVDKQAALETNSKWLKAYALVDAEIKQQFDLKRFRVECGFRCENILDEDYRVVRFAPMPLREFSAFASLQTGRLF